LGTPKTFGAPFTQNDAANFFVNFRGRSILW